VGAWEIMARSHLTDASFSTDDRDPGWKMTDRILNTISHISRLELLYGEYVQQRRPESHCTGAALTP